MQSQSQSLKELTPHFEVHVKLGIDWTTIGLEDIKERTAKRDTDTFFLLPLVSALCNEAKHLAANHARKHGCFLLDQSFMKFTPLTKSEFYHVHPPFDILISENRLCELFLVVVLHRMENFYIVYICIWFYI